MTRGTKVAIGGAMHHLVKRASWCTLALSLGAVLSAGAQGKPPDDGDFAPASRFPYRPGVDVMRYDIALTLPERGNSIVGKVMLMISRRLSVDTLVLDLRTLAVDAVEVQGSARPFVRDSATIRIPLTRADGAALNVTVRYHGVPTDGLIIREDSTRGWSAFGDNWPNRARFWIPSIDHPSDKALVNWTIDAPSDLAVIANGVRRSRTPITGSAAAGAAARTRTRFEMRQPIPTYLMVIAAARLTESPFGNTACGSGIDGACVPQSAWTFADGRDFIPGPFARLGEMVQYFARIGGSFPYEHLDHLQSATRFGGMENATAIFYSDDAFKKHTLGEGTVAHETAHQWFGDAVTPQRWQDLWLSEGFASYWAPLFAREAHGDSTFLAQMRTIRDQVIASRVTAERPVVDSVGAATPLVLLNENSYQKGAFVLHMLRAELGDVPFFLAVRTYQQKYRHRTATTDDLRAELEMRVGRNLAPFFNQWLHRPGWADLTMKWHWHAATHALTLDVTQGTRFAPFALPLTLVVRDADGHDERVTVSLAATARQTVAIPRRTTSTPVTLTADPDVTVLGRITLGRDAP